MMNRSIASVTAAGMLLLIGLALPPPGTADDQTPPDQSPDVTERGVGDVLRSPPRPNLIGQQASPMLCGPGLFRVVRIVVRNLGKALAGASNTIVSSYNFESIVRTGALPPGGTVIHLMQVHCPQGPCPPANVRVDVDGEVTESNEMDNVFYVFLGTTCP